MNWNRKRAAAIMGTIAFGAGTVLSSATPAVMETFAATVTADSDSETYSSTTAGENAVLADGTSETLTNPTVTKSGDTNDENADFNGTNAAVLARNGATLTISGGSVTTNGSHANGVFSYGEGTTVNISDTVISTSSNNSGGIMTTGGAVMNATDLTITTSGNSSAAIRSDRGGGDVNVSGGTYMTEGVGSPAIYSTADIDVENATLSSSKSEGIVIEGANSVSLENCDLTADNTVKNGQAETYQGVMIYQSMSGDAAEGTASFAAAGGTITSENGAMFYVTNTTAEISLDDVTLNNSGDTLLAVQQGPWGNSGSNGGQVTFTAKDQTLSGAVTVDSASSLNLELDASTFTGSVNADGDAGSVYVSVPDGSTWTLTADSYVTSLTCDADSIDLNGYTLYVNGTAYTEGTSSEGSEVTDTNAASGSSSSALPQDNGQQPPQDNGQQAPQGNEQQPPQGDGQQAQSQEDGGPFQKMIETLEASDDGDGLFSIEDIQSAAEQGNDQQAPQDNGQQAPQDNGQQPPQGSEQQPPQDNGQQPQDNGQQAQNQEDGSPIQKMIELLEASDDGDGLFSIEDIMNILGAGSAETA